VFDAKVQVKHTTLRPTLDLREVELCRAIIVMREEPVAGKLQKMQAGSVTVKFAPAPFLPEWLQEELPHKRRVLHAGSYAIHFIDEGRGPVVLLQHGNPTWCFLWRKVIHILLGQNVRVVAPDLVGLGLSDKPRDAGIHTLAFHANQIETLVKAFEVQNMTLVGQDWRGPVLGLIAARNPKLVQGVVFANTALSAPRRPPSLTAFHRFSNVPLLSDFAFRVLNFPIPVMQLVQGDRSSIGAKERRAYRYPLRSFKDRIAPLALARMVPTKLEHPNVQALKQVEAWAGGFAGPVRLVWGRRDPIMGRALGSMTRLFPKAEAVETDAGHFLQEEVPDVLSQAILQVISEKRQK